MWGWKAVERTIESSVSFDEAKVIIRAEGFALHASHPQHAILKRAGTQVTAAGSEFPIELAIAQADRGLFLSLRYDAFALFDTGDLDRLADEIAGKLEQ